MSFEFQSTLINLTPEFRISGEQIGGVRLYTTTQGVKVARVIITGDKDIQFAASGKPYELANPDDIYATLSGELAEVLEDELLINPSAISSVRYTAEEIVINIEGDARAWRFRPTTDEELLRGKEIADHIYELPTDRFAELTIAAGTFRESVDGTLEGLNTAIVTEIADRIAAITAEEQRVDELIASGMWLFDDQAAFPPAAENHGRVVHSHAEGAIFYAHAGAWHQVAKEVDLQTTIDAVANEATARVSSDDALSARLDVLEADPTTAAAVAAGDAATLSSANTYTDTSITNLVNGADAALDTLKEIGDALAQGDSDVTAALTAQITTESTTRAAADAALSGRLDTLEADPTTQSALDAEVTARTTADSALDGRVATLEGNIAITDPTTATAVAAVQSDVDANQTASESADSALSGRLDVLEADPTTQAAVDLKANKAGDTFTGDIIIDEGTGSTIKLETSDATSAGIHIEGPTGSMGYIDTTNGFGNDSLQVYSANFWVRAINGGTGNVIIDGTLTLAGTALTATFTELNQLDGVTLGTAASAATGDFATAAQGALADTAVQPAAISNIDNTSDADKPVSTAQQAALDLRALLDGSNIPGTYNNDTEAAAGGVPVGGIYKNSNGTIHWRVS